MQNINLSTQQHAEILAQQLIPNNGEDPFWVIGARRLTAAIISDMDKKQGETWGFPQLQERANAVLADADTLKRIVQSEDPEAITLISGYPDSVTAKSICITMLAHLNRRFNSVDHRGATRYAD